MSPQALRREQHLISYPSKTYDTLKYIGTEYDIELGHATREDTSRKNDSPFNPINNVRIKNRNTEPQSQPSIQPKIVIIDDDPIVTTIIREHIRFLYPDADVQFTNTPTIEPGFDIYFIDNDFGGQRLALNLLNEIRTVSPQALVVALSTTLDLDSLQLMVNKGCNAVYNKRRPRASIEAQEVISNYISILREKRTNKSAPHLYGIIDSLNQMIREWNKRLSKNATTEA